MEDILIYSISSEEGSHRFVEEKELQEIKEQFVVRLIRNCWNWENCRVENTQARAARGFIKKDKKLRKSVSTGVASSPRWGSLYGQNCVSVHLSFFDNTSSCLLFFVLSSVWFKPFRWLWTPNYKLLSDVPRLWTSSSASLQTTSCLRIYFHMQSCYIIGKGTTVTCNCATSLETECLVNCRAFVCFFRVRLSTEVYLTQLSTELFF